MAVDDAGATVTTYDAAVNCDIIFTSDLVLPLLSLSESADGDDDSASGAFHDCMSEEEHAAGPAT